MNIKIKPTKMLIYLAVLLYILTACSPDAPANDASPSPVSPEKATEVPASQEETTEVPKNASEQIYLYGEIHVVANIVNKEYELWYDYYHNQGMRHLFIELPYYTSEFLNMWMDSDNDDIFDAIYHDWAGSLAQDSVNIDFYKKIKSECPETIFHGTDVGHQNNTTGKRFLDYLENNGLENSEQYVLAIECIEQGTYYYENDDYVYRENTMAENFIREFDKLQGESIMGIYGAGHTDLEALDPLTKSVPCMANQLKERYGDALYSEDLSWLAVATEAIRTDTIIVNDKEYVASYYGKQNIIYFDSYYTHREFWRLEDSFEDFKNNPKTDDVLPLPYDRYPMVVEDGQVFVIDYIKKDDPVDRRYFRSDGNEFDGRPITEEFYIE